VQVFFGDAAAVAGGANAAQIDAELPGQTADGGARSGCRVTVAGDVDLRLSLGRRLRLFFVGLLRRLSWRSFVFVFLGGFRFRGRRLLAGGFFGAGSS
jgi:hypothetical protein